MTTPARNRPTSLDQSHREAWVLHAALTSALDRALEAGETPHYLRSLVLRVEAGETAFNPAALSFVADALATYLETAPDRDEAIAARLLDRARTEL